jgi:hypothetical protein
MRRALYFIVIFLVLISCRKSETQQENEPYVPNQPTYKVGDYYRNDTLEGIVFWTYGNNNGLMVSLDETYLPWCIPLNLNCETGATNPYEGWNNTNILMDVYDMSHYPAIQWSYLKNTWQLVNYPHRKIINKQWYVPSTTELRYLLQNQEAVNATLASMGYPTLEDKTYWSSTETGTRGAATVRLQSNEIVISDVVKTLEFYVRAIRAY